MTMTQDSIKVQNTRKVALKAYEDAKAESARRLEEQWRKDTQDAYNQLVKELPDLKIVGAPSNNVFEIAGYYFSAYKCNIEFSLNSWQLSPHIRYKKYAGFDYNFKISNN